MHEGEVVELCLEPVDGALPAMDRAAVDDPEDALGRTIGFQGHHLGDEGVEGVDGDLADDLAKEPGPVHVPRRDVGTDTMTPVFVHSTRRPRPGVGGTIGMTTAADGNLQFVISADEKTSSAVSARPLQRR